MARAPAISVVTPTAAGSRSLCWAIESVKRQTRGDWELLVMGAGEDDDPRVRFHDLALADPINAGVARARGRTIALLDHTDLWLPDHLEHSLGELERTGADLVFALSVVVRASGEAHLGCAAPGGRWAPHIEVPASTWVMRRELADRVGPWLPHEAPAQAWLRRARESGADLRLAPWLSVLVLPQRGDQQRWFERSGEPDFRARELCALALRHALRDPALGAGLEIEVHLRRALANALRRVLSPLGLSPEVMREVLRQRRRALGDAVARLRPGLVPR